MKNPAPYFIGAFILIAILLSVIFFSSRKEYKTAYDFEITDIDEMGNGAFIVYNKDERCSFSNYLFTKHDSIMIGDRIIKKAGATLMYIYRKDLTTGKYKIFLVKKPNGNFPR